MLGSHFDLDREIARIASKRETEGRDTGTPEPPRETHSQRIRAYSDFDRRIDDFVGSVGEGKDRDDADHAETSGSSMTPAVVRGVTGTLQQIR